MASNDDVRTDERTVTPVRLAVLFGLAGIALAIVASATVVLAQLAGWGSTERVATPGFLTTALGAPQADASLVREPVRGVRVAVADDAFRFDRDGVSAGLSRAEGGAGSWTRFERGTVRATAFGHEAIVLRGERGIEQFLTVERRQGRRTWRWRLTGSTLEPRSRLDGSIELVAGTRSSGLQVDPVAILDARGGDVTPAGLRWTTTRRDGAWWLELELDDRNLPLPYVIDPAITANGSNTAVASSPLTVARPGAVGDLLIAQILIRGTGTITPPAGWTLLQNTVQGTSIRQAVYWKLATGSESTQWSWTGGTNGAGIILAYANPHPTAAPQSTAASGTTSPATATGLTTTHPQQLVVALYGQLNDAAFTQTGGQGLTQAATANTGGGNPGNRVRVMAADGIQAAAGATGNKTATSSGNWVAQLVSFRQAPDDGDGTIAASPTGVASSSTGNTITFTYTAGVQGMDGGAVAIDVPAGWSAPSTTGSQAGYATASTGTVGVSGQRITVSGVTLAAGGTLTVVYGSKASAGPGATASSSTGAVSWATLQRGTSGGTLTSTGSSPSITQYAANGSGTATASPTIVPPASPGNTVTVTYTAASGGMSNGAVTVDVPTGWSAPSTTNGNAGYTTASTGAVSVSGQKITVSGVTLAGGATLTVTYGTGTGPGATATATPGNQTWQLQQRSVSGGTLTNLASSPQVSVDAAPTATVSLSPSSPATNQTLTATATKSDADGDPVSLTYVWKVDGSTVKTTAGSSSLTDTLDLSSAGNGDKGQTVSVEVTPNDGIASGSTVSDSETVANSAPTLGSVSIDQGSPKTNDALSVTVVSADADGDARTYGYQWRKNGADIPGATAATLDLSAAGNGSRGDQITVRVTASDGSASSAPSTSSAVTIQNSAPVVDSVAVDQASPTTNGTLTLTVTAHDDDGDGVAYAYAWTKNGADLPGATSSTLDLAVAGNGDKGDALRARVTGSDGSLTSSPVTSSPVTVADSLPTATVALAPTSPTTNQTLTATATKTDADADVVTLTYVWKVNGATVKTTSASASLTDTLDLSVLGQGDRGQTVAVEVTPNDGAADGSTVSDSQTVANSAPTLTSVSIDQASPATNDALTVSVLSADDDGDARSYSYQWAKNGSDLAGATASTLDLSAAGNGDKGDTITVRVTASDGTASSTPTTTPAVTVANSAPTLTSVTIDQPTPKTNDTLTVTLASTDPDGDPRSYSYQWAKNAADRFGETAAGYDLALIGNGDRGDAITVRVIASDGIDLSAATTSAAVTVANSSPLLTAVSIDQPSPRTDDTLTATISAGDPDGDALTPTRQWRKNGVDLAGATGATLDLSAAGNGDRGDQLALRVSVSDGAASGGPATSAAVTVQNAAPTITSASIDQASPGTNATVGVSVASADLDGDAPTYAYQWRRNGLDLAGETGATLDLSQAGNGDKGDAISVRVTASDGTDASAPTTTASVTVANSLPTAAVSVAPAAPTTNATLTATATKADADGDTVGLTYVWKVDGVTRKTTSGSSSLTDTLDLSGAGDGDRGQTVSVEVTPNDGSVDGAAASDSTTVANSAPTATVSLAPASPTTDQTVTATATEADPDGDGVTLTYVWKVDGVVRKTTAGSPSLTDTLDLAQAGNGDKGQTVSVEVAPNDGSVDGAAATDSAAIGNSAPTVTSAAIDQASPHTGDTLTVAVSSADADGDARTLAYQWRRNGVDLAGETGAALDLSQAGNGDRGDTISVRVTADDGSATSTPVTTAAVTVLNTAPTATVALAPAAVGTNDTLTATATKGDDDGDAVTLTYVWKVNGTTVKTTPGTSSLSDTLDLSQPGNGGRGDTITVEATPSDGTANGTAATDAVGVDNALPTATVSLAPGAPATNATLTATATRADTDGDAVTLTYVWKVNGTTVKTTPGTSSPTDTLDLSQPGNGGRGDTITVEATPNDGTADGTAVTDSETVANSAPTATVALSPGAPTTNELVTAAATTGDLDGDTVTLTYVWKVDGTTVKTTSGSSSLTDTLDLAQAGNGDKGQTVSVEVTPDDGSVTGADASDAAVVANSAPVLAAVSIVEGAPRTNDTLTVSYTASDADGDTLTPTRQWRRNGADLGGQTAASLDLSAAGNGDRGDQLAVRVSVSDGSASSGPLTSAAVTVQNTAPTVVSATIDQATPATADALTVTVVTSDPDGDARTVAYQWAKNGVDRFGETASGYDLGLIGNGDRGDQVAVRVVASDGTDASAPVTSAAVTVANSAPVVDSVSVVQASPATNDTLTLAVTGHDPDGDTVTYGYQWRRNGADVGGATAATLDLSQPGNGDEGDQLAARVTADDGTAPSSPLTSAAVTVANSAPTATVSVAPTSPTTNQTLTATATAGDVDAGDAVTLTYVWKVDGVTRRTTAGTTSLTDTFDLSGAGDGDRGQSVTVEVTPDDGDASGTPASDGVTVANSAPTIASVSVDQTSPATGDTLSATVVSADADGDARTLAYQWRRNGADIAGATGPTLDLSQTGNGDRGDTLAVRVTASDGVASSGPSTSPAVTVANSAPTVTSVAIDQPSPRTNDLLTVSVASADADGDARTLAYQWRRNGADIAGATGPTLDLSQAGNGDRGDTIAVRVTADDGTVASSPATSAPVTVQNTAPSVTSVSIDQASPRTDDTLTLSATTADADGDAVTLTAQWRRNGADIAGATGSTLDLSQPGNGDRGDAIAVRVTADDGTGSSAPTTSAAVAIANSAPAVTSVAIDQASPRTNDVLSVAVSSTDADGDARTVTYQWRRNGVDLAGETGATLDLSQAANGDKGDAISVRVAADDGSTPSAPSTSASVTVANSAPTVTSVAIDQASPRTNDTLTVTLAAADADGDTLTTSRQWRRNGTDLAGQTAATLDLSQTGNGDKGDTLALRVTVADDTDTSAPTTSASVTVQNTAPICSPTAVATTQDAAADTAPLCADDDTDTLAPAIAAQGTRGTASVLAGQLHYVPDAGAKGADSFTYRADDGTDLSAAAAVAVTIDDVTAPQTTIDAGPADGSVATTAGATFAFSSDEAPSTFECRLDGGPWNGCTSPRLLTGLAEGPHTFDVRATDDAANTDPSPASRFWTVDSLAPDTTLATTPTDPSNDATPTFTFSSEPGATFDARLDGGSWTTVSSPYDLGPLADGAHTLDVRATDAAGNVDASPASWAWVVDTGAPTVTLDDPGANLAGAVSLTASADDAGGSGLASVRFERSPADAGTWTTIGTDTGAPFAQAWATGAVGDGLYDLRAVATDAAGNETASAVVEDRRVDNGAPTIAISAPADGGWVATGDADPYPVVASTPDTDVTKVEFYVCTTAGCADGGTLAATDADGAPWTASLAVPGDGAWALKVVATDAALNTGTATADAVVDRTAPTGGSLTVADGYDTDGSVAIATDPGTDGTGSGVDAASAVVERDAATLAGGSCGAFAGAWSPVSAPDTSVAGGACYRYRLRVRDHAGNWATFGSASVVKVDLTAPPAPSLALAAGTATHVAGTTVFFRAGTSGSFDLTPTATDPESGGITYGHPDLGAGWSRSGTTWSFTAAAADPGEPSLVTATNAAGLTGAGAAFTVTADAAAPTTTGSASPAANATGWTTATPVAVTLTASDAGAGVAAIRYTLDGSVPGPTSPVYTAPIDVVALGTTIVTYRAEDLVGNLEAPQSTTVKLDTTAPSTPTLAYGATTNASFDGTVLWFRPGVAGGFTVSPSAADGESGIGTYAYPALGAGWSNTGGTYAFGAAAADPTEPFDVVATNGAGLDSAGAAMTVTADATAPASAFTCDAVACTSGWYTTKPVTVVVTATDGESGLDEIRTSTDGSAPSAEYLGPLSLAAEGTTTVRASALDNVGNAETPVAQDVRIDTVAPTASMGPVAAYLRGTVSLGSTQSDATSGVGSVQFQVSPAGAGSWSNVPATWDTTGTANGEVDVRVRVTDVAGNVAASTPVTSRWVDNLAPTVTLDPVASPASGTVALTSSANDAHSGVASVEYAYSVAGAGDWRTDALTGANWDTSLLVDGVYDVRVRATDNAGNVSAWSVVNGVQVDNHPPTVALTAPSDGSFVNASDPDPFTLAATASDGGTGVATVEFLACAAAGATCSSWTSIGVDATAGYAAGWTLPGDGQRLVKAVATDGAGHTSEAVAAVTVDRTAPAAAVTAPAAGADVRLTVPLTATASDAGSGVNSVDFQRSPAGAGTWTTIASDADGSDGWTASLDTTAGSTPDGLYDLRVFVTDAAGNTTADTAAAVRVDNTAPTGTLIDPGQYLRGSLALSGTAADAGSGVASVAFQRSPESADTWTTIDTDTDGGDGWSATFDTTTGATPDGRYDLRELVTDRAGNTFAHALPGRTVDNTNPSAAIDDPGANLRLTVALTGQADDATAGVASVAFELDGGAGWQLLSTDTDGSNGWSASLNTTLPATPDGLYDFRITATDRAGNRQTSVVANRRIDNTAPSASLVDPGQYLMGTVQLLAGATDAGSGVDTVRFERSAAGSGGPWTQVGADAALVGGQWRTMWTTGTDGLYDLRVVVDDQAGNRSTDVVASRRVDNTAPVTTDDAVAGRHNTDQTVTLSRTDAGSGPSATQHRVKPPSGSFGPWQSGTSVTILASAGDGVHTIEYYSTDAAGNVESVKSTEVLIDTTGPSGTVADPSTFLHGLVTLTATADDPSDVSAVVFEYAPEGTTAWTEIGTDLTADGSDEYSVDWDTTAVADIAYDLQVTFRDSLGNPTVRSLSGRTVDNELPAIALTAPAPGAVKRNTFAITATATDGVSGMKQVRFEVKLAGAAGFSAIDTDAGAPPTYSTSWNSTGAPDGPTDLRVIAEDAAGNLRSATTTIFVDNDVPSVAVHAPSTAVSGDVTLTATGATDIQTVVFRVDGAPVGTDNDGSDGFSATWSTTGDGARVVTAEATDVGGNVGTSAPVTVQVDNTAPTGTMTSPGAGDTVGGSAVALAATTSDAGSGVSGTTFQFKRSSDPVSAYGSNPQLGSSWDTSGLPTGAYNLRARITDNAGNVAYSPAITVQVDSSAPTVVLTTPGASGVALSGTTTLAAAVSGADAQRVVFAVVTSGGSAWTTVGTDTTGGDGWTAGFDTRTVADGAYDVRARVFDSYGNLNESVRTGIRIDNTTPRVVSSSPTDGETVPAAPGVITVTASEALSAATATIDGGAVASGVSGASLSIAPGALATGPHTVAGTLTDLSGKTAAYRVHFTILSGSPSTLPYVERNASATAATSLTAVDGASRVIVPAGATSSVSDWLVIRIQPIAASSVSPSPAGQPSSVVDVTARWALAGTQVHNFLVPLEIVLTSTSSTSVIPATYEGGAWRTIRPVPTAGRLPEGRDDGFFRDADGIHVLTRHLTLFALVRDVEPPSAPRAIGVVGEDGLTLRWLPGEDNSGVSGQVRLYVNGVLYAHYDPTQTEAKLGPWSADDTRRFTFTQLDLAGNESAPTRALRGVPALTGKTLAEAQAALADRGFAVGGVTERASDAPPGTVVEPAGLALAEEGAAVDLVVAAGATVTPPQARLAMRVVGAPRFSWRQRSFVALRVKVTVASSIAATLMGPRGGRAYTWRARVRAGASILRLPMPRHVRRPGVYRIVVTASAAGQTARKTVRIRIVRAAGALVPARGPVVVALAADARLRARVAPTLRGTRTHLVTAAGDTAFDVAADPRRNVRVVVVDVGRYGASLVRDLRVVFPGVRLVALVSRPGDLLRATRAGATVALPRSTPPAKLARVIRRLATRR
ncbi:MAG: OmpL47-type beta-barrel domain-containing protein [Pseudomonadota bacterium]